ncbi:DUF5675 family protein [Zhouia sp. PK063]|uniref:DUF5675 family protein n=1 Tax=Zhouia sp. PK063 TaxID=3373602 RepID=UPI0037A16168
MLLIRTYGHWGTNGRLVWQQQQCCHTIELPWRENHHHTSCIPEGRYPLKLSYSKKFGWHLRLYNVPHRSGILIHAANNALTELQGCIAPVMQCTGEGKGTDSRIALNKIKLLVYPLLQQRQMVFLNIIS